MRGRCLKSQLEGFLEANDYTVKRTTNRARAFVVCRNPFTLNAGRKIASLTCLSPQLLLTFIRRPHRFSASNGQGTVTKELVCICRSACCDATFVNTLRNKTCPEIRYSLSLSFGQTNNTSHELGCFPRWDAVLERTLDDCPNGKSCLLRDLTDKKTRILVHPRNRFRVGDIERECD